MCGLSLLGLSVLLRDAEQSRLVIIAMNPVKLRELSRLSMSVVGTLQLHACPPLSDRQSVLPTFS